MRSPKLLIEVGPMADPKKTGVGYYVDSLTKSLARHYGNEVDIEGYYFNFLALNPETLPRVDGIRFRRIWLVPGKLLSACRRLGFQPFLDVFTNAEADVVFFTNYVSLPLLRRRQKVALAVYDLGFLDYPEYMHSVNLRFLQRFCPPSIRRADIIVTISEFTKQRLRHHFPDLKADIIVTPIPPAEQPEHTNEMPERLTQLGLRAGHYILYLGTIEPRKNLQNLALAYAQLGSAIRESYDLVLAGGKGWKDEAILAEISRLQSRDARIIMPGYISDQEKAALYSQAACFVLPSHYEGFGMPILEAMQYGLPVAVSDIPVLRETAGDAALYFDKDRPEDIANKLQLLLSDSKLAAELAGRGKLRLEKYSWEQNARVLLDTIKRVVGKP